MTWRDSMSGHGNTPYTAPEYTDASHTSTFELHTPSAFKLKIHLIIAKYPKHPSLSQYLTKKKPTWKRQNQVISSFFFVMAKISFNNLEKLQRHKHPLLAVYFF
jgi:hypothetical protein